MEPKNVLLFACVLACVSIGTALRCYVCGGSATSDCAKAKTSAMSIQECNPAGFTVHGAQAAFLNRTMHNQGDYDDQLQAVCLKLFMTDYQPKFLLRACGIFPPDVDPCDFMRQNAHVSNCKSCRTDLCNKRVEDDDPVINIIL